MAKIVCPNCNSADIVSAGAPMKIVGDVAHPKKCQACGYIWTDARELPAVAVKGVPAEPVLQGIPAEASAEEPAPKKNGRK